MMTGAQPAEGTLEGRIAMTVIELLLGFGSAVAALLVLEYARRLRQRRERVFRRLMTVLGQDRA